MSGFLAESRILGVGDRIFRQPVRFGNGRFFSGVPPRTAALQIAGEGKVGIGGDRDKILFRVASGEYRNAAGNAQADTDSDRSGVNILFHVFPFEVFSFFVCLSERMRETGKVYKGNEIF